MYDTSMHITPEMTIQALNEEIQRLNEITQHMDGFQETAELFEIGAVLGVSDYMGRSPDGGRPGPEHGDILSAVKALHQREENARELLRDCIHALTRMDAHEGLCDQIRALLNADEEE